MRGFDEIESGAGEQPWSQGTTDEKSFEDKDDEDRDNFHEKLKTEKRLRFKAYALNCLLGLSEKKLAHFEFASSWFKLLEYKKWSFE